MAYSPKVSPLGTATYATIENAHKRAKRAAQAVFKDMAFSVRVRGTQNDEIQLTSVPEGYVEVFMRDQSANFAYLQSPSIGLKFSDCVLAKKERNPAAGWAVSYHIKTDALMAAAQRLGQEGQDGTPPTAGMAR